MLKVVLARAVGIVVGSGGQRAMTLVAYISIFSLLFFHCLFFSWKEWSSKKKYFAKVGLFGTHWWQFWIFEVRRNNQIKTYSAKVAHASFQAGHRPARKLVIIMMIENQILNTYISDSINSTEMVQCWKHTYESHLSNGIYPSFQQFLNAEK